MKLIGTLLALFMLLIVVGVSIDASHSVSAAQAAVHEVDNEILKQEKRFIENLPDQIAKSGSVTEALSHYKQATTVADRQEQFTTLVRVVRPALPAQDASLGGMERRAADELAGALNRREVALQRFQVVSQELAVLRRSWRGKIASFLGANDPSL